MPALTVPAENFLLQFIEGGNTIVMCVWPGRLKQPAAKVAAAPVAPEEKEGPEPQVDLVFTGEGKARRIAAAQIEFQGKPVYAGIIEQKGLWQDEDATPPCRPTNLPPSLEAAFRGQVAGISSSGN